MISTNNSTACFTSNTCEWETKQDLFDKLNDTFHFNLDVCATPENAKCERYFTKEDDGLKQEWSGRCWMNPPYGKEIADWMRKAYESINLGGGWSWFAVLFLRERIPSGFMIMPCKVNCTSSVVGCDSATARIPRRSLA